MHNSDITKTHPACVLQAARAGKAVGANLKALFDSQKLFNVFAGNVSDTTHATCSQQLSTEGLSSLNSLCKQMGLSWEA